jgi:MinD superfamily P-loop ATPase
MKEVVVLSGKGGTGKTSIVASFAALANSKVMVDCDVDAADLHLILQPTSQEDREFWSGQTAFIDRDKCLQCDICKNSCRFEAIKDYRVDPIACEGCAFCSHICPVKAISMENRFAGNWFVANTISGYLVHACLGIAQENSGKMIATIRKEARQIAVNNKLNLIISDGPPGIGCPVISSLSGVDLAVLVTEPTLSGIHDLERVLELCHHFNVPAMVCINKYDINEENTSRIENFCKEKNIEIAARIPFDNVVTEAMINEMPVVDYSDDTVSQEIKKLWSRVCEYLNESKVTPGH